MQNLLHRVSEFISTASPKRTASVLGILLIALAIPLTVVTLQQQQEVRQHASTAICSAGQEICVSNVIYGCHTVNGVANWDNVTHVSPGVDCTAQNATCTPQGTSNYYCKVNPTATPSPVGQTCASAGGVCMAGGCGTGAQIGGDCIATGTVCCKPAPTPTPPTNCTTGQEKCAINAVSTCVNGTWGPAVTCKTGTTCQLTGTNQYSCISLCQTSGVGTCRTAVSGACPTGSTQATGVNAVGCGTGQVCCAPTTTCTPKICQQLGFECGTANDGCGGTLHCGVDSAGKIPGDLCQPGGGLTCVSNKCVKQSTATPTPTPGTLSCGEISGNGTVQVNSKNNSYSVSCNNADGASFTWTDDCNNNSFSSGNSMNASWNAPSSAKNCTLSVKVSLSGQTDVTKTKAVKVTTASPSPTGSSSPSPSPSGTACTGTVVCLAGGKQCNAQNGKPQTCDVSSDPCGTWKDAAACTTSQVCSNGDCIDNSGTVTLALNLGLDGIGTAGDHQNSGGGNTNPKTPSRPIDVDIYNSQNQKVGTGHGTVNYDPSDGRFHGNSNNILTDAGIGPGAYRIFVKSPRYLRKALPGIINLVQGVNKLPQANLTAGDIVDSGISANSLTIQDYNVLTSCWIYSNDKGACNSDVNYQTYSDLNDDGIVDHDDYDLLLREWVVQNGD